MASLDPTERAKVALAAGESLRVTTAGQCTVQGLTGAPATTTTLTANSQNFGPYGVSAVLLITGVSGRSEYSLNVPAASGGTVPGDGNSLVAYSPPPDVVRLTGSAGIKCGAGRLDLVRVESGGSVTIVVYDNPAAASGRQIYSGTLSAGGSAQPSAWAVNGMWATISSGAVEFVVSEG